MPQSKALPQIFMIIHQADGDCLFLPNSIFWRYIFWAEGEREDSGVEKITKINKIVGHQFL